MRNKMKNKLKKLMEERRNEIVSGYANVRLSK